MNGKTSPRDSWRVLAAANIKPPCRPPAPRERVVLWWGGANAQVQTHEKQTTMREASKPDQLRGLQFKRQRWQKGPLKHGYSRTGYYSGESQRLWKNNMKNSLKKNQVKNTVTKIPKWNLSVQIRQLKNKVTNWETFLWQFRVEQLKKEVEIMGEKFKNTMFRMRSSDTPGGVKSKWTGERNQRDNVWEFSGIRMSSLIKQADQVFPFFVWMVRPFKISLNNFQLYKHNFKCSVVNY